MNSRTAVTSVQFTNFKALEDFSLQLGDMNILVGPNNSGKSTILSAFRILAAGIRRARSRKAEVVRGPRGPTLGHNVPTADLSISLENVHTDLAETDTTVTFRLSNRNLIRLLFPRDGGCVMTFEGAGRQPITPSEFVRFCPLDVVHVPILGPVEYRESLLKEETVRASLNTHRASRHFRNYWHYYPAGFDDFAQLVSATWPGLEIEPPEVTSADATLWMYCRERRMTRELFWAGFGFQVWCQMLTHLHRAGPQSLFIVDEPEIYLHPDLQRQLVHLLHGMESDVVIATHSTEIVAEADPGDILLIDKARTSAQRLRGVESVQSALDVLGSNQNTTLTQLARNRKVIFFEGKDFKIVRRFAGRAGYPELASGAGLTVVPIEGFSSWDKLRHAAWGLEKTLGMKLKLGVVLDPDFRPAQENERIRRSLEEQLEFAHIHDRKEIENYLLVPAFLSEALRRAIFERARRLGIEPVVMDPLGPVLDQVTAPLREYLRGQYIAHHLRFHEEVRSQTEAADVVTEVSTWFETMWSSMDGRMQIVPGKAVLGDLNSQLQARYQVNLTPTRIIDAIPGDAIPDSLSSLLETLERFRSGT